MQTDPHPPLHDVRVLDASRVLAGPFCGQILGDLGAEVIKIERPGSGDETRQWGPPFLGSLSAYYLSCNRNKKAITLDIARKQGIDLFYQLVQKCDVVIENFRTSSADKLGLSPANLLSFNPRLIVCSISGFGRTGPMSDLPGYDFAIQALSGLMSITGPKEGPPSKVGVAVTDVTTGLYSAIAILACLHARKQSGHGYAIDMALLDCAVASQVNVAQAFLTSGKDPERQGNAHLQIVPYELFATADSWLVLAVGNDGQWQRFCMAAEQLELAAAAEFATNIQRVQNRNSLVPTVADVMRTLTTSTWQERLLKADVPHAPVWNYSELFASSQVEERGMRMTVRDPQGRSVELVGSPFHIAGSGRGNHSSPTEIGQASETVLRELLGIDGKAAAILREHGII